MNLKFAKLIVLMLALAMVLGGCNLIEIDARMQAEEDIAKLDQAYSTVVARYDGGEITAGEAMALFNASYNEMYYMYQYYFGMEMTAEEIHGLMEDALMDMVRLEVAAAHFDADHTLTDAEIAQAEADAQTYYDEAYASMYEYAEGRDAEAKDANTLVLLKEIGMDAATNSANTLRDAKASRMEEILRAEVDSLSNEDLLIAYEERVSADEETYSMNDGAFEAAMMEEDPQVYWTPEGYRTVKHILLIPEDAVMNAYVEAMYALDDKEYEISQLELELDTLLDNDAETTENADLLRSEEDIRADLQAAEDMLPVLEAAMDDAEQACLDNVKSRSDEIYSRLEAGEDFDVLMAEFGEDPGMQNEPTMSFGYCVSAYSANWEQNFTNGAMALENVGDVSAEPVVSGSGVHIIRYQADLPAGAPAFEDVKDSFAAAALEEKQIAYCDETLAAWVAEANPSYDVEAFEKAVFDSAA